MTRRRRRRSSAAATTATATHAEIAWASYDHESQFAYIVMDMPDFDQVRDTLPNSGLCYCGPASTTDLLGYVATSEKPRAETPLLTTQGDPLLAHWQYGLGRAVAFTSDAKAKWGSVLTAPDPRRASLEDDEGALGDGSGDGGGAAI